MKIVIIPDLHEPFAHRKKVKEAIYITKQLRPTHIVQIGDAYDLFAFSRFPRRYGIKVPDAQAEVEEARANMIEFWASFSKNTQCYQLMGNHSVRLFKRIMETLPQIQGIFKIGQLWEFPNVKTLMDERVPLELNGILFQHGYKTKLGAHVSYNLQSTVVGHSHRGGVVHYPYRGQLLYELNAGYLADPMQEPLMYRESVITNWTHGFGLIDELGPRFIPL